MCPGAKEKTLDDKESGKIAVPGNFCLQLCPGETILHAKKGMAYKIDVDTVARCLECGDVIKFGRPDKKFCCESCKNRYHNRLEKTSRSYRVKVRSTLVRNYEVLNDLVKLGISRMSLFELRAMGYDPQFVTAAIPVGRRTEFMCYDIRFRQTDIQLSHITKIRYGRRKTAENDVPLSAPKEE